MKRYSPVDRSDHPNSPCRTCRSHSRSRRVELRRPQLSPPGTAGGGRSVAPMAVTPAEDLLAFIDASPSPYHCVAEAARRLERAGFEAASAGAQAADSAAHPATDPATWNGGVRAVNRGYVRSGGALVAWSCGADALGRLRLIGAHTDSPNLRIVPRPDSDSAGFSQLSVAPYGGLLANSWLDRDLGLSGRVAVRAANGPATRLFRDDRPLLRVPQLAVHLDRSIGAEGLRLDPARHLTPVWGLGQSKLNGFAAYVAAAVDCSVDDVLGWDVMAHDLTPAGYLGLDESMICASRLDNQASCFGAVRVLSEYAGPDTAMIALFDHEEIGSESSTGASGAMLAQVLDALAATWGQSRDAVRIACATGGCLSADMAHATHPNYSERHDPGHPVRLGGGPVVKVNVNQRYATDAVTAAGFRQACDYSGIPHQTYSHRNDLPCGSTIGPITATRLAIPTVDVGMAMLSMHSIREMMGTSDVDWMIQSFAAWLAD